MRLYSRNQVVGIVLVTMAVTCIGVYSLTITRDRLSNAPQNGTEAMAESTRSQAPTDTDSFKLDTNAPQVHLNVADGPGGYTQDETQNISVYEKTNDAVVNITTETVGVNWFLEPVPQEGGSGSGSIIDTRGYVVTNTHVIADATRIFISLSDGSQYEASVVGTDKENDIAVLKFAPPKNVLLKTIPFGESASLKVGQKVLAIGNPFGLARTLTTGIVSALGRPIRTENDTVIKDMIQTDAAINPGNSGGPLLDTQGRMIGINTMIYSTSGSSSGIGFAIPVNTAKRVVAELIQYGKVRRGTIDAELVPLNASIAEYAGLKTDKGLLVSRVGKGGNAERAGLKEGSNAVRYGSGRSSSIIYLGGDIITSINGQSVTGLTDYLSALEARKPGETVELTVLRGKQQISMKITLAERSN